MIDQSILREFEDALRERGIIPQEGGVIADGRIHRCNTTGKNGKGDGAYRLYPDPPAAGWIENWQDGLGVQTWKGNGRAEKPSEATRAEWAARKKARQAQEAKEREEAEREARRLWDASPPADPAHPYLTRKMIPPDGLRQDTDGNLLVPMQDTTGTIRNVQRVFPDGKKRFHPGASVSGLFFPGGPEGDPDEQVVIVEGMADAVSVFRSTGRRTYAAMTTTNLQETGLAVRRMYPESRIVFFADHDTVNERTGKRIGIDAANEAARKTEGQVIMSSVEGEDPNDVYLRGGAEEVRALLASACPAVSDIVAPSPSPRIVVLEELKARTVLELLEDASLPEPEYVVEGVLAIGELLTVFGPPKVMKSFTVKTIGLHAAAGVSWLEFPIPRPFKTIYLSAEGREVRLRQRFQTLVGFSPVEEEGLRRMSYAATLGKIKLDSEAGQKTFFRLIEPFEVVILDPYYRFIAEGSENVHEDQRPIQDFFDRVKDWGKALILVHHSRKPGKESAGISELRGAGLDAFTDSAISLYRKKEEADDNFVMRFFLRNDEPIQDKDLVREGVILVPGTGSKKFGDKAPAGIAPENVIGVLELLGGRLPASKLARQLGHEYKISLPTAERAVANALAKGRIGREPGKRGEYYLLEEGSGDETIQTNVYI